MQVTKSEFESKGSVALIKNERKTKMRPKFIEAFEENSEQTDENFYAEGGFFEGDSFIMDKRKPDKFKKSDSGKRARFLCDNEEDSGKDSYSPTSRKCIFLKIHQLFKRGRF